MNLATKITWPSASRFLSWDYLKERIYINNPQTLEGLKQNLWQEIDPIWQEVKSSVMNTVVKRAQLVLIRVVVIW